MTISLRLNNEDTELVKSYANMHGLTVSEFVRKSIMERIEDELDLKAYNEAMEKYKENPVSYSLEEIEKELDLWHLMWNSLKMSKNSLRSLTNIRQNLFSLG